jgi:hypothetical protein
MKENRDNRPDTVSGFLRFSIRGGSFPPGRGEEVSGNVGGTIAKSTSS